MTRRLLGPIGGPILFFLVTISVFGVLGWVTHSALRVEQAQREAAARAELGSNLRVALWRLDGRMLPALGVEYSRPFYQYGPADPLNEYGFAATPLLTTNLPDWMKLHFQLDAAIGWDSPQVLHEDVLKRVQDAWGLELQNVNGERAKVLADLQKNYPARAILDEFTSRDRDLSGAAIPFCPQPVAGDAVPSSSVSTPLPSKPTNVSPNPQISSPNSTEMQATIAPSTVSAGKRETIHFFGVELCLCSEKDTANNLAVNQLKTDANDPQKKSDGQPQLVPGSRLSQQPISRGRGQNPKDDVGQQKAETGNPDKETTRRAFQDVQPPQGPKNPGNYLNNYTQNSSQGTNDTKLAGSQGGLSNTTAAIPPVANLTPNSGTNLLNPFVGPIDDKRADLTKFKQSSNTDGVAALGALAEVAKLAKSETDRNKKRMAEILKQDELKKVLLEQPFFHRLMDTFQKNQRLNSELDGSHPPLPSPANERKDLNERTASSAVPVPTTNAPPGNTAPVPNGQVGGTPGLGGPAALVNYLGSMRPQWIVGSDGSDQLVLVRVAKVDNKDVSQGIVLDWVKLESMLKDEVKDLFPDAKLIPVKESSDLSPDRVMTSLPIQLDPGQQPEIPPAGLTTLRLGLLLAWAAAIIACGAVGFCGWTLIDLAERRIRFVSAVTHELRTPLTSLRLYLDLLVSGMIQDEAKKQEYLNTLTLEADRLHRLIDNVLDFARLEKRRKDCDVKPVPINDLVEQLRQTWADRLTQEGRELVAISTLPLGQEVKTDTAMVQQIIGNLIDNARKYSRDAVDRRIWIWAKPNGSKSVVIEVEDRGPGVPTSERRSIFKPFRRGEQADKTSGGAGLGLALAKSWAEVLGGKLCYRQADGGMGACFRLELPVI